MEHVGIIGGADGPTAIYVNGGMSFMMLAGIAAAVAVVAIAAGVILWMHHRD